VFNFQYPFPLLPLKSFSFKDILLWSVKVFLENREYCKSIEKLITKYQHKFKEQTKLDILWDNFKLEVRDKTIDHCKKLTNQWIYSILGFLKYLCLVSNIHFDHSLITFEKV
jgi:hypothetical protein